jgi:hypothetical protein
MRFFPLGGKWPECEANHSSPSIVEVKNELLPALPMFSQHGASGTPSLFVSNALIMDELF